MNQPEAKPAAEKVTTEKEWTVVDDSEFDGSAIYGIHVAHCVLTMVTEDYQMAVDICDAHNSEVYALKAKLEQAERQSAIFRRSELSSNQLYTALRAGKAVPEELKGTGLGCEVQALFDRCSFYVGKHASQQAVIDQMRKAFQSLYNSVEAYHKAGYWPLASLHILPDAKSALALSSPDQKPTYEGDAVA